MPDRILVEFTADTDTRTRGDRMWVDPKSATSFVEKKKVAVRVEESPEEPKREPVKAPPVGGAA